MSNVPARRQSASRPSVHRSGTTRQRSAREPLVSPGMQTQAARRTQVAVRAREVIDITESGLARDEQPNADMNVVRALMFAQGIDEQGRRLALASDEMTDEEKRPFHIVAQRQTADQRPAQYADVYRRADHFGDGRPNVTDIRPLTRETRLATRRGNESGDLRFDPVEPPVLRVVPSSSGGRTMPRQSLAPTASSRRSNSENQSTPVAIGALALAPVFDNDSVARSATRRPILREVAPTRRPWGLYSTFSFWTMFVVAFLFAAVVMHAGLASRQVKLDRINVELERSEATNNLLHVEVARLQSPQRIAAAAARLGLVQPDQVRFVKAVPASSPAVASGVSTNGR
jgi:hypothetical protein